MQIECKIHCINNALGMFFHFFFIKYIRLSYRCVNVCIRSMLSMQVRFAVCIAYVYMLVKRKAKEKKIYMKRQITSYKNFEETRNNNNKIY